MSSGTNYLPHKDGELAGWLNNYATVAAANHDVLGLTTADVQAAANAAADFRQDITDAANAHTAAKSATVSKEGSRKTAEQIVRAQVKRIQSNPNIPNELRSLLKITVPKPRRKVLPVFVPAKLVAQIKAGGIVALSWDANGNESGVIYVIESSSVGASSGWKMVNAQSSTHLLDGSVVGTSPVYYRVRAKRGKVLSDPGNVVVITLGASPGNDLRLSDAA